MKNILKFKYKSALAISSLACALFFSSCEKYTELTPLSSLDENTAFTSAQNMELAINGVYWHASVGYYDPGTGLTTGRGYPFGGASLEQGEMRGEDMMNLQAFYQFTYESTYTAASANNVNMWEQLYSLINQSNVVIEGVKKAISSGIVTAEVGNPFMGEALFMRALAHHELLLNFARPYADNNGSSPGVPYRTIAIVEGVTAESAMGVGRGTVAEAYTAMLKDLDEAELFLPNTRATKDLAISRATKGAAIALKTRIKLHKQDYDGVIVEANKMGASATSDYISSIGNYKLETNPSTPFTSYKNNLESIFSIAQSAAANAGVNGAVSNMFGPSTLNGRDLVSTSPLLYNATFWKDGDLRKTELQYRQSTGNYKVVFNKKYTRYGLNDDWNPIIRYAEVLLNAAEAQAYKGNNAQALNLLNAVRNRSVLASDRFVAAPADIKLAIYQERRIEFTGEGRRWGDIHRLALNPTYGTGGIPAKVMVSQVSAGGLDNYASGVVITPSISAIPYANKEFIWPLPTSEINSNPLLRDQQNPGY